MRALCIIYKELNNPVSFSYHAYAHDMLITHVWKGIRRYDCYNGNLGSYQILIRLFFCRVFEVRCLHIPVYDRTPFEGLI